MRKFILLFLIIALLGGGGFCLYWFVFRNTNDGGYYSNRETLFAVQNVLENNGVDLNEYIDDAQKVTFTSKTTNAVVYADVNTASLTEHFSNKLQVTVNSKIETEAKSGFESYENVLVDAWKLLYSSVYGNVNGIRQNVFYATETYKSVVEDNKEEQVLDNIEYLKISSNYSEIIVSYFNKNEKDFVEIKIEYNFRNTDVDYTLTVKNLKADNSSYVYKFFNLKKVNNTFENCENVVYNSTEKYIAISNTEYLVSASSFVLTTADKNYVNKSGDEDFKTEVFAYLVENYDLTFYSFDVMENVKSEPMKKLIEFKK